MLYPLLLNPVLKERIWGGDGLKNFNKDVHTGQKIGESWEVSGYSNSESVVLNGIHKGRVLSELLKYYKEDLVGQDVYRRYGQQFPLLVKLLDAHDKLSIQVHPDDNYASIHENGTGKTEMWYILDAKPGAQLVYGLKPEVNRESFKYNLEAGTLEKCMNFVYVKSGDCIFIPSGTVHAILDGISLIEIQQSSDLTYRVFDWNRVGADGKQRELHIDKALEVINFSTDENTSNCKVTGEADREVQDTEDYVNQQLVDCEYFTVDAYTIKHDLKISPNHSTFKTFTVIDGQGELKYDNKCNALKKGDSCLIPTKCSDTMISGDLKLVLTEMK